MAENTVIAGRFELVDEAGSGGMGTVYRARDRTTGRSVALKVMAGAGGHHDRFLLECNVLSRLSHPAIVGYIAHGQTDQGEPYLAMEWLEGETVAERLTRGPLSVAETISVARQIADALATAHSSGVIHRDLKPSNLFLCDGRPEKVRVLDFGVARLRELERELTLTNQIIGTPGYMAPEQARGARQIDARADLFALGCVMFRCITGRAPFDGADVLSVLAKLVLHEPPPVGELVDDVPEELETLIVLLLQKSPAARPASAAEVRDELDRISASSGGPRPAAPRSRDGANLTSSCVVLARDETNLDEASLARLGQQVTEIGGRLQRLANGALLIDVPGDGTPREQAARAARCARALAGTLTNAQMSIAAGPTEPQQHVSASVLDAASRLLAHGSEGSVRLAVSDGAALHRHLVHALDELGVPIELAPTLPAASDAADIEQPSSSAVSKTLPVAARRRRSRRTLAVAAAALVAVAAVSAVALFARDPARTSARSPLRLGTEPAALRAAPAAQASSTEARIAIVPPNAAVTVDGARRTLDAGMLSLRGKPGDGFDVVVRLGARSKREHVVLGRDGRASTSSIELDRQLATRPDAAEPALPSSAPPSPPKPPEPSAGPAREKWE